MKKLLMGAVAAACLSCSALVFAQDSLLKTNHPDSHTVIKGDTLWDISEKFLASPWKWPEIWQVNPQIENPHLIYPGDKIRLIYVDGKPRLVIDRGPREFKLSPSIHIQPIDRAIPAIPLDAVEHFLSRSRVVGLQDMDNAPYVLMGKEQHLIIGAGDTLYARGVFDSGNSSYGVYRAGDVFTDPETEEVLGLQALDIGTVKIKAQQGDIATFAINRTTEEIRTSDRLLPVDQRAIDSSFFPTAPEDDIEGVIMAVEGGVSQVARMDVVVINRGEREGLMVGNVLQIFKEGGVIRDRIAGDSVQLPDEKAGLLMIFRSFEKMSYGLVLEAERPLSVGDRVSNP